jgi:hypothetical protein
MVGEGMVTLGVAGADLALEVLEVGQLDVLDMAHLVDHAHHGRGQLLRAVGRTMVTGMSVFTPPICSRKSMWK